MSKNIEFINFLGNDDSFPPVLASSLMPGWYVQSESYLNGKKAPNSKVDPRTIKRCVPVYDSLTSGYIIRTPADFYIERGENGEPFAYWATEKLLTTHSDFQVQKHPQRQNNFMFKLTNHWVVKTPKGYSCLFTQPMHHDLPLVAMPAIVDTDVYNERVQLPFTFKDPNFEGLVPAGTPIYQVIPFKRDSWKMNIINFKFYQDIFKKNDWIMKSTLFDAYRNNFWRKKDFK